MGRFVTRMSEGSRLGWLFGSRVVGLVGSRGGKQSIRRPYISSVFTFTCLLAIVTTCHLFGYFVNRHLGYNILVTERASFLSMACFLLEEHQGKEMFS